MSWRAPLPNQAKSASASCTSLPLSVLSALARSSRNLCRGIIPKAFRRTAAKRRANFARNCERAAQRSAATVGYQCTVPLAPGPPGLNFPSSDTLSPGTGVPAAAPGESESPPLNESSEDAHADSSDAITRNRTALSATRFFTRRTYPRRYLMQAAGSHRFSSEERQQDRYQISRF